MLQSYSDDSIDTVMKKFWLNFFSCSGQFYHPEIKRFVPNSVIEDFKNEATVSSLVFTTEIPGETLLDDTRSTVGRNYKITVKVEPTKKNFSIGEFIETIEPIKKTSFGKILKLGQFIKRTGYLKDNQTNKTSPFELGSSFEIQPTISLSKYISFDNDDTDFDKIKDYCFNLLQEIKPEIYNQNGIQER